MKVRKLLFRVFLICSVLIGEKLVMKIQMLIAVLSLSSCLCAQPSGDLTALNHRENLQRQFIEDRFGMFICYNIMSYGAKWSEADYPISSFNPDKLDCGQWARAAKSAGMKFLLLTTKHHEGFCLWDSTYTDYDVASTPFKKDVVKEYADAFRKEGLKVGLYYSIWDSTHGIRRDAIGNKQMEFIKGQIRELLTNYGKIDLFVIDGWYWQTGHRQVPFNEIRNLIRELQPDCLMSCHTHLQAVYHVDLRWKPDSSRSPLPPQGAQLIYYVEPDAAVGQSGEAEHAIDSSLHRAVPGRYKHWFSDAIMPQWIKLDLGTVFDGLQVMTVVPNHKKVPRPEMPLTDGNIKKYELYLSDDDETYRKVAEGEWKADAQMKTIAFDSDHARYLKLTIIEAENDRAIIAEIGVGAYSKVPWIRKIGTGK